MKWIKGYEGLYKITSDGEIFSIRGGRFLSLNYKKNGYVYIELNVNGVATNHRVHRLVAEAYIPNPENKPTVNHINGKKADNRAENLEWATVSENTQHAYDMGLLLPPRASEYLLEHTDKEPVNAYSYEELSNLIGYGSSQITHYIKSGETIRRGNYKNYILRKIS